MAETSKISRWGKSYRGQLPGRLPELVVFIDRSVKMTFYLINTDLNILRNKFLVIVR